MIMKKILIFLYLLIISTSCVQEDTNNLCELICETESVIETIVNRQGKIVHIENDKYNMDYWMIEIDPEYLDNQGYALSNETTLVPCNFSKNYTDGTKVLISGRKMNCCNLITYPWFFHSWGCKFEITSIEPLTDKK